MFNFFRRKKKRKYKALKPTGYVYFIKAKCEGNPIKIGYSIDPKKRLKSLQTASPVKLKLVKAIPGNRDTERNLHRRFKKYRIRGEWFKSEKLLSFIKEV